MVQAAAPTAVEVRESCPRCGGAYRRPPELGYVHAYEGDELTCMVCGFLLYERTAPAVLLSRRLKVTKDRLRPIVSRIRPDLRRRILVEMHRAARWLERALRRERGEVERLMAEDIAKAQSHLDRADTLITQATLATLAP